MNSLIFKYSNKLGGHDRLLICFHQGGGGASLFKNWPTALKHLVDVVAVQLPGREDRLGEPLYTRVEPIVLELSEQLKIIPYGSIMLFGYCMGGLIAFELARAIEKHKFSFDLSGLLVAAAAEPEYAARYDLNKILTDDELKLVFSAMFAKRHGVSCQEEYMNMMLPILKADREININYHCLSTQPLQCPLFVFGGENDSGIPQEALMAWKLRTTAYFSLSFFPGDHMFIETHENLLLSAVENILRTHYG